MNPVVRSHLLLQIVYPSGEVFKMPAGGLLEMDMEDELAQALMREGVGVLKSAASVERSFRKAFREAMYKFKDKTRDPMENP